MITWTTYGTWLQGDKRGYVKDGRILEGDRTLLKLCKGLQKGQTVKLTKREMATVGEVIANKLNKAVGPTAVVIPLGGFTMYGHKGEELYDPEADIAFIETLKKHLKPQVKVTEVDAHIHDPVFAETVVPILIGMMEGHN